MKLRFEHLGITYHCDTDMAWSLAIPLDFSGDQPNFFGTDPATKETLKLGDFVASTRQGSGCNVDSLSLIPHCNGTHSETIGHILDDMISIGSIAEDGPYFAALITVPTTLAGETNDSYQPDLVDTDTVITAASLKTAFEKFGLIHFEPAALIIRTLPNTGKQTRRYTDKNQPPFFSADAMQLIVDLGVDHLLVDLPSVDRMHDDGLLTNHHIFWNVPAGTHETTAKSKLQKTITEMIFVDDNLTDSLYLLDLQIPAFVNTDAAPSRPIVYPLHE